MNNDTIRLNVESKFKESHSKILKLDDLSTNQILTPDIKAELKDLDIKNFAGIEILKRNGTKVIQVEDKILVFDSKDKLISPSFVPYKVLSKDQQQAIIEAQEKIKISNIELSQLKDNPWSITTKSVSID